MKLSILMAIANSSPVYPIMHWMIFQSKWRTRNLFSISANANDFMFSRIIMAFHVIVDFVWWCTADMPRLVNFLAAPEALKRVYTNLSSWQYLSWHILVFPLCQCWKLPNFINICFLLGWEVLFLDLHLASASSAISPYTLEHGPPSNHLNVRKLLQFHYCQHLFASICFFEHLHLLAAKTPYLLGDINVVWG